MEQHSGYPCQAVVDSGASTFIMKHPPEHFKEYRGRKNQNEIAKQGAHLNSVGEGTLPIMLSGGDNLRVNLDLEDTLYALGISKNLFSEGPAVHALATGGDDDELVRRLHEKYSHTPI